MSDLIDELAGGYPKDVSDGKAKEQIRQVIDRISPTISRYSDEGDAEGLWNRVKEDDEIQRKFQEAIEDVGRTPVIYVSSKFKNSDHWGPKIVRRCLE